jgi:hypothetical protein
VLMDGGEGAATPCHGGGQPTAPGRMKHQSRRSSIDAHSTVHDAKRGMGSEKIGLPLEIA